MCCYVEKYVEKSEEKVNPFNTPFWKEFYRHFSWKVVDYDDILLKQTNDKRHVSSWQEMVSYYNLDIHKVVIKSTYDKLRLIARYMDVNDTIDVFVSTGGAYLLNPYRHFYASTPFELVNDSHIKKFFKGWSKAQFKQFETEIEPLFQKIFKGLKNLLEDKIEFVCEFEQPKQSISYQLGEEVIEAELIENEVVEHVEPEYKPTYFYDERFGDVIEAEWEECERKLEHSIPKELEVIEAELIDEEVVEVKQVEVKPETKVDSNIQTYTRNNKTYFNARNVWKQLGVKSSFSSWIKAKKRKALLENSIQTIEFRSGRNTRSVDWLIPIEFMEQLKLTVKGK